MNKKMFGVFVLVVIGLTGLANASSSDTLVNFTVHPFNESENNSFDGHIVDLEVEDRDEESISWVWENSDHDEFSYNLIFLDSILVANGTMSEFEAVDLDEDECYEILVISIGLDGSEGPRVSDVACTLEEEVDKETRKSGKKTGIENDVIPNFFVEGNDVLIEEVVISLTSPSVAQDDADWLTLLCWILGLLIFVMFSLISILLVR